MVGQLHRLLSSDSTIGVAAAHLSSRVADDAVWLHSHQVEQISESDLKE